MRVLFLADLHIKLGQKKVPVEWQTQRFLRLFQEIHDATRAHKIDKIVIGGDYFDSPKPSVQELVLGISLLYTLNTETVIFSGNHECFGKRESILSLLAPLLTTRVSVVDYEYRSKDFDVIPYTHLHNDQWVASKSKLLLTHVRGNIGGLVKSEIDLDRLKEWELVLAGDLHEHSMTQENIVYPGSPINTSFARTRSENEHGYIVIDTETLEWAFHPFDLPQLIRKTVSSTSEIQKGERDHIIYEVEGDSATLSNIKDHELLDKKVNTEYESKASLQLRNLLYSEELAVYLKEVQGLDDEEIARLITKVRQYD